MSHVRFVALGLLITTSTVLPAGAQPPGSVPRVLRFDGQAPAGATGALRAVLALYDAATGGAPIWQETQVVQIDAGRYAVLVGASDAEGLPPSVLASREPRWLEVQFDGYAASPRALLTSVPYALRASDADTLGGLPASAFLRAPAAGSAGAGAAAVPDRLPSPTVNTGTAGYLGKFTNTVDITSSVAYENGGRLGVGTTAPQDYLSVRFSDPIGAFTGYAVQNLSATPTSYSGMLFYDQNGVLGQFQGFNNTTHEYRINNIATGESINFMLGSTPRFTVTAGGIGIGTTVPSDPLEVPIGWIRTGAGLRMFGTARYSGVSQEAGNTLVNFGLNDNRTGTFDTGNVGGFFRVDTRGGQPLFGWWHKASGSGAETSYMSISATGFLTMPGVRASSVSASPLAVMVDSNGLLGIMSSSRRYKEDIRDMAEASDRLMALRPARATARTDGKASVTAGSEPGYIEMYDRVARRLGSWRSNTFE